MNDAAKAELIICLSLVPVIIVVLVMVWISQPVPLWYAGLCIICLVFLAVPYAIPRYKHYRKALAEFEEFYRYETEAS